MYCSYCGKPIPDDSNFCPHCGKMLKERIIKTSYKVIVVEDTNYLSRLTYKKDLINIVCYTTNMSTLDVNLHLFLNFPFVYLNSLNERNAEFIKTKEHKDIY